MDTQDAQETDVWKLVDETPPGVEGVGGFVLEFGRRASLSVMQVAVNETLVKRGVSSKDVISINPTLSLSRREVWYYKGASGD